MAKYIVARGQIEKGRDVIARQGETYRPKDAAETKRLLACGAIVPEQSEEEEPAQDEGGTEKAPAKGSGQKGGRQRSNSAGGQAGE